MITGRDPGIVLAMANFLSWQQRPGQEGIGWDEAHGFTNVLHGPPALYAYTWGLTMWCPPNGEL